MFRAFRRSLFVFVVAAGAAAMPARAAVPEQPQRPQAPAPPDTSHFLPGWLHLHGSIGYGWIQGPAVIRQRYEAGQDFQFGLEARPGPRLRVHLDGEYQVLPAVARPRTCS